MWFWDDEKTHELLGTGIIGKRISYQSQGVIKILLKKTVYKTVRISSVIDQNIGKKLVNILLIVLVAGQSRYLVYRSVLNKFTVIANQINLLVWKKCCLKESSSLLKVIKTVPNYGNSPNFAHITTTMKFLTPTTAVRRASNL